MEDGPTKRRGRRRTVTMRDVARESGFSPTTVSIALNDAPLARYLPAETKARIKQVARRLGYRPNPFARSLVSQRSQSIGIMVFDVTDPYCTLILRGIEKTLFNASFVPIFSDAHNDPARFARYLEMLLSRRVEALIIVANWLFLDIHVLGDLANRETPTVVVASRTAMPAVNTVDIDNKAGGRAALAHLFELGHRDIAFIRGPQPLTDTGPRWAGVREYAKKARLPLNPELIVDLPASSQSKTSFEVSYELVLELVRRKRRFTAVMAFDDMSALGAMRALSESGIRVPEQCSVVGFDDIPVASLCTPALTTVRQPMEAMGEIAAEIVIAQASDEAAEQGEPERRLIQPELVVRSSTMPLSGVRTRRGPAGGS